MNYLGGDVRFDELMRRLRNTGFGKSVSASEWQEVEDFIHEHMSAHASEQIDEHVLDGRVDPELGTVSEQGAWTTTDVLRIWQGESTPKNDNEGMQRIADAHNASLSQGADTKRLDWLLSFIEEHGAMGVSNLPWTIVKDEDGFDTEDATFDREAIDAAMKEQA